MRRYVAYGCFAWAGLTVLIVAFGLPSSHHLSDLFGDLVGLLVSAAAPAALGLWLLKKERDRIRAQLERRLIEAAQRGDGSMTVANAMGATGLATREAQALLDGMRRAGVAELVPDPSGVLRYVFPGVVAVRNEKASIGG